jgi:hypothetical protein
MRRFDVKTGLVPVFPDLFLSISGDQSYAEKD